MFAHDSNEEHIPQSGSDIFSKDFKKLLELPVVELPKIINPVVEMKIKIRNVTDLSKVVKKMKPIPPSKCGLGKTQGVKGTFRGISMDSLWEAAFYIWMVDIKHATCIRNTKSFFTYTDADGKPAKFYPDFFTREYGYCEVKGIFRPNDVLKKSATMGTVKFFGPVEMKKIIKDVYKFNPKWKEEYVEGAGHLLKKFKKK